MAEFNANVLIEATLDAAARGLGPFVANRFQELVPQIANWPDIIAHKDRQAGRHVDRYNPRDLSIQLRAITERLGALGYPFAGTLNRQAGNCASELRNVRNKWAHREEFTVAETYRALDSAEMLLRTIGADAEADELAERKQEVIAVMAAPARGAEATPPVESAPAAPPSQESAPVQHTESADEGAETDGSAAASDPSTTTIDIRAFPVVSYAHAYNAIPVVSQIRIVHDGEELRAASVELEVHSAAGPLGDPRVHIVDLGAQSTITLRNPGVLLDPVRMQTVESQIPGSVQVTLRDALGNVRLQQQHEVTILAGNQWMVGDPQLSAELLASFVQPQSAAIAPLLLEASDILRDLTGNSSLDGYQSDSPERVDAIAKSIYEAMRARDIRYSEPPASWGLSGQKVRTPGEVLEGRLGTCLDTTVTLAAALEEAGINSTLWLIEGHIFLGYWRHEASLDSPAELDASEAINFVGLGHIGLIETTQLTGGADALPFETARRTPHLSGAIDRAERILSVTDVREARRAQIIPLPSRSVCESGDIIVQEYKTTAGFDALTYTPSQAELAGGDARRLPRRVEIWKNALLDLSLRNRLINYTERAGHSLAVPQPSLAAFEDMLNDGVAISLVPADRIPDVERVRGAQYGQQLSEQVRAEMLQDRKSVFVDISEGAYTSRLRALAYKARTIAEETGANNLYVALGMLRWKFNDRDLRSPLILVPVRLEESGRGSQYRLRLDESEESTPNYCLLEKLRVSFGLDIPGLANPVRDDSGINLHAALAATRQAVAAAKLPFTVDDTADLSILQFGKYRLWKDLDENWETFAENPLVHHLIHTPTAAFADPVPAPADIDLDELSNSVPVPADSSQLQAVAEAGAGRTFVLEGPPGTGKSQTITNLLAHALVNGKKVLFVAEKRAALDVVKQRLDSVGLGPFSLDLHDKGASPNAVRAQIRNALDATARPDAAALKADQETAVSSRGRLRRYAERLHEPNAAGLSLYTARDELLAASPDTPILSIPQHLVRDAHTDVVESLRQSLRQLPETADLAHPAPRHAWGFVRVDAASPSDPGSIHRAAQHFDRALDQVLQFGADHDTLRLARSPLFVERWSHLVNAHRHPIAAVDAMRARDLTGELGHLLQQLQQRDATPPAWADRVSPECLNHDVHAVDAAAKAADASGFFGRTKRRREALTRYGNALRVAPKEIPARAISALTAEVSQTAHEVDALRGPLLSLPVAVIRPDWNPYVDGGARQAAAALEWLRWLATALAPNGESDAETHALRAIYTSTAPNPQLATALAEFAAAWRALDAAILAPSVPDGAAQPLHDWAQPDPVVEAWQQTRGTRAVQSDQPIALERWIDFARALEPLRTHGLAEAHAALMTGEIPADLAVLAFDKGIAAASIDERATTQALTDFDAPAQGSTIRRFTTSAASIRNHLPQWLPAQILSRRRIDAAYDGGQLGELKRQLSRQRGGMSVRALFEHYADLITDIAPCVLMSPESVSRFFRATARMFDIVVFDEASQIRVADAIGAMGRGVSVVVVGDSKQMPPTSFAEVAIDAEFESGTEVLYDEESILSEAVQAQVPRQWLSWHYRSQDEALINFSNHKYYEGRLASFPAPLRPSTTPDADHGISLVRVDGSFNRKGRGRDLRTNLREAEAIVTEVSRRFAVSPDEYPSLGIITFNAQQRSLIETMLRETPDERISAALDARDGLFVKNLENVQGDERDVILFSVAFSANDRGMIPLNFGPLSRAGGERRLNVAITRARRQVILFASFDPADLRTEGTSSVGVRHLKSYLELAAAGTPSADDEMPRHPILDRHREEIANELRLRGYAVQTDVGLSDFRVDISVASADDPAQPFLAILLDGQNWHSRRTVADRDGLPVEVLSRLMRWPGVSRVWLPEWLEQRDVALDRLEEEIRQAAVRAREAARTTGEPTHDTETAPNVAASDIPSNGQVPVVTPPSEEPTRSPGTAPREPLRIRGAHTRTPAAAALRHPDLRDFKAWPAMTVGTTEVLDGLPSPTAVHQVRTVIHDVVTHEGPIHKVRLVKLTAAAFGLTKVHASRSESILRCVPKELEVGSDPASLWPAGSDPLAWREVRQAGAGESRNVDHVPLAEIANAMRVVADLSGGMDEAEIKREALSLFGGKRMTSGISAKMDQGLAHALKTGRIERRSSGLFVAVP